MIKTKHHPSIVYRIYDELKEHVGRENAISATALASQFDISDRQLRMYINEIRNSSELEKFIGSSNEGYFVCMREEVDATINRLKKQALSILKVCSSIQKKADLNGQYKMPLGDYYKDVIESLGVVKE